MRLLPLIIAGLLCAPTVAAEFGAEDDAGYPVSPDGFAHDPTRRFTPEALAHVQALALDDLRTRGLLAPGESLAGLAAGDAGEGLAAGHGALSNDYPSLNHVGPATVYPYYPILMAEIQRLALDHPDKVRVHRAGTSTVGLDLTFLEIYNIADEGQEGFLPLEQREVVWIDGGTHSNEYSGVYFVLALAQWLLDGSPEDAFAQWVVENRHTWILPMVNPDGSHLMGRLNANLVNINRNYPVIWGGDGTDDLLNNPGPTPASEIETRVNIEWMERLQPDYYASVHCCGNLWLYPYGEDGYDPLDNQTLATICREALPDVLDDCGPIWSTIYPASGSSVDTAYEYTGAAAFGFEMSGRSNLAGPWGEPLTFEEVAVQERESWSAIVHAFANVHLYGGYPVLEAVRIAGDEMEVVVRNAGYGPLNATIEIDGAPRLVLEGLGSNATAAIRVPAPPHGLHEVRIDYQKRIMAAPMASLTVPLAIGVDAPGALVAQVMDTAQPPAAEVPATPLVVLLAALAWFARRR